MQESIMAQGFDLLLYGMGSVYVFLTLLVFATRAMSWCMNRFFPELTRPVLQPSARSQVSSTTQPVEPKVLRAIQEAIHQHRAKNQ